MASLQLALIYILAKGFRYLGPQFRSGNLIDSLGKQLFPAISQQLANAIRNFDVTPVRIHENHILAIGRGMGVADPAGN